MSDGVFFAVPAHPRAIAELSAAAPTNPFATAEYFESRRRIGFESWVMGLRDDTNTFDYGCGAFLKRGWMNHTLEIVSLPAAGSDSPFWGGLRVFCRQRHITQLILSTFASSEGVVIPAFGGEYLRRNRCEFVMDLGRDPPARLTSRHERNVKKALKAGLTVSRTRSTKALDTHIRAMQKSMERRHMRGESVPQVAQPTAEVALLESGAGELFQAILGGVVLSSVLVLRSARGGYYHSAGTTPDGMSTGASHFLIRDISMQLKAEGARVFMLGGAADGSTLAHFKEGFATSTVNLPEVSCYIGPAWKRRASAVLALARSDRKRLLRLATGSASRLVVYAAETARVMPPEATAGLEFRRLSSEELRNLSVDDASFHERQRERLNRFGACYAYAVLAEGRMAHVSWLLPPAAIWRDAPQVLQPREGEAEIAWCETLPAFRGKGIDVFAIRSLFEVARGQGVHRIFMKTVPNKRASRSGIEKAGLSRTGSATLIVLPVTEKQIVWRRFR